MSVLLALGVGVVGGIGALARFGLDRAVSGLARREFPYGTLAVNILGAFALGLVVGVALGKNDYELVGTGLVGGFTTFSTWALESHRLAEEGELRLGALNFLISLILGLAATWAGRHVGALL